MLQSVSVTSLVAITICTYLEADEASKLTSKRTVASVLIEHSREVVLPQPISPPEGKTPRADQQLHNEVSGESHIPIHISPPHQIVLLWLCQTDLFC